MRHRPTFLLFDPPRLATHLALAGLGVLGCWLTFRLKPDLALEPHTGFVHGLTIGTGYVSLLLIVVTLLIGPWKLTQQRRNPVNINLRRDTGIWAGITGSLHVVLGFQVHLNGDIVRYFFEPTHHGLKVLDSSFGVSNYVGAAATLILLVLLLISNDLSLRWLKGPRWKSVQRFNYLLIVLVLAHTVGYQIVVAREPVMKDIVLLLTGLTIGVQGIGLLLQVQRNRRASWGMRAS